MEIIVIRMRQMFYSSKFRKALRKMPKFVREVFLEKEGLFLNDPFHPSLETHKLHGKYKDYRAFTVVGQYRVMFRFMEKWRMSEMSVFSTSAPAIFISNRSG